MRGWAIWVLAWCCWPAGAAGAAGGAERVPANTPPPKGREASYAWYRQQYPDPVIFTAIGPPGDPAEVGVSPRGQLMTGKLAYSEDDGTIPGTPFVAGALAFGLVEGERFVPVGHVTRAEQSLYENRYPIVFTSWDRRGLHWGQTAFARPLRGNEYMTGQESTLAWTIIEVVNLRGEACDVAIAGALLGDDKRPQRDGIEFRDGAIFERGSAVVATHAPAGWVTDFKPFVGEGRSGGVRPLKDGGAYNVLMVKGRLEVGETVRVPFCRAFHFPGTRHWQPAAEPRVAAEELTKRSPREDFDAARARWASLAAAAARFRTPDDVLDRIVTRGMLDGHFLTKWWNGRRVVFDSVCYRCQWDDASMKWVHALDLMGDHRTSRALLDTVFERQGQRKPRGALSSEGCFSDVTNIHRDGSDASWASCNGWALWAMAEHARLTDDRAWLAAHKRQVLDGCAWIVRERRRPREKADDPRSGLIHGKFVCDLPDDGGALKGVGTFTYTDAISYLGLSRMAGLLAEWGHEEGKPLAAEAEAYRKDIVRAVTQLTDRSTDPWFVPWALDAPRTDHAYLSGVCGPINLAMAGVVGRDHELTRHAIRWNVEKRHDGFVERSAIASMFYGQDLAIVLLEQGRVEEFLRMFYAVLASNVTHETLSTCEWRTNTQPHVHSIASLVRMVRTMLVQERDGALVLLQGTPRAWLEEGKEVAVDAAPTAYGPLTLRCASGVRDGAGLIRVKLSAPPRLGVVPVRLKLRLPGGGKIAAARLAGEGTVEVEGEWLVLRGLRGDATIEATIVARP